MIQYTLIYPMAAMVGLTFFVLLTLFRTRARTVQSGQIDVSFFDTYQGQTEPDACIRRARHFVNIFEAPSLFYVACLAAMVTGLETFAFHILAWTYVSLRAAHAHIHMGANKLRPRIAVYFTGWMVLLTMWGYLTFAIARA